MSERRNKSLVWQYFQKLEGNQVKCLYCDRHMSYTGNTSNMASHIKRRHKELFSGAESSVNKVADNSDIIDLVNAEMQETDGIKKLNNSLLKMIVKDMEPLAIVEHEGFRSFVRDLNPLYQLPSRKKLTYELLPNLYSNTKAWTGKSKVTRRGLTTNIVTFSHHNSL